MMRRFTAVAAALLLWCSSAFAFDWKPEENDVLYNNMMDYAKKAYDEIKCYPAPAKVLKKFIDRQDRAFENDPYAWIAATYRLVYNLQKLYPVCIMNGGEGAIVRKHAYHLLDYPIHVYDKGPNATADEKRAWEVGRNNNWNQGCKRVLAALKKPAPAPGTLQVLKVYNMGYVLRTSERCFAIDICWRGSKGDAEKLASYIDVMFVTHPHGDHYTDVMLQAVLDAGKKLVLSKEYGPADDKGNKLVYWDDIVDTPVDICGISMRTFKGNQGPKGHPEKCPNNVYYLQFDGWTIVHHGDNADKKRDSQIIGLGAPDIVFNATWNRPKMMMDKIRQCADASEHNTVFISSHENEYGHRVQQRESYWETYRRADRYGDPEYNYYPWMTMEAGENFTFTREYLKNLK